MNDLKSGDRFGMLEVVELNFSSRKGKSWLFKCDCGKEVVISYSHFWGRRKLPRKNCGCKRFSRDGNSKKHKKIYHAWKSMHRRCSENFPESHYYFDKGVKVCEEWSDGFEGFLNWSLANGVREGLTLDRIDFNGNYEPNNCRWATPALQTLNRGLLKKNKTGFNGACETPGKRISVTMNRNYKKYALGIYDDLENAKTVRLRAEKYYEENGSLSGFEFSYKKIVPGTTKKDGSRRMEEVLVKI